MSIDGVDIVEESPGATPPPLPERSVLAADPTLIDVHPPLAGRDESLLKPCWDLGGRWQSRGTWDPLVQDEDDGPRPIGRRRPWGRIFALSALVIITTGSWAFGAFLWLERDSTPAPGVVVTEAEARVPVVWVVPSQKVAPIERVAPKPRTVAKRPVAPRKRQALRKRQGKGARASVASSIIADVRVRQTKRRATKRLVRARRALKRRSFRLARKHALAVLRAGPDRRARRRALKVKRSAEAGLKRQAKVAKRVKLARKAYKKRRWSSARRWARAALRLDARNRSARRLDRLARSRLRRSRRG